MSRRPRTVLPFFLAESLNQYSWFNWDGVAGRGIRHNCQLALHTTWLEPAHTQDFYKENGIIPQKEFTCPMLTKYQNQEWPTNFNPPKNRSSRLYQACLLTGSTQFIKRLKDRNGDEKKILLKEQIGISFIYSPTADVNKFWIGKFRVDLTGYLAMALLPEAIARNMGFLQPLAMCQAPCSIMTGIGNGQ